MSIPGVGDCLAIIKLAKQVKENFIEAPKQFQAIQNELNQIPTVLERLERYAKDRKTDVAEPLANCQKVLDDTYGFIKKLRDGSTGRVAWERITWDQKAIDRLRDRLVSCVLVLITITTSLSQEDTTKLVHVEQARELREAADWLSSDCYKWDHASALELRLPGTGEWLLQLHRFDRSMRSSTNEVLHLHGIPGAGKTILTSRIVDHLQLKSGEGSVVCFYYCKYTRDDQEQTVMKVFRCLARQLLLKVGSISTSLRNIIAKVQQDGFVPSMTDIRDVFRVTSNSLSKVYIVVDALDECSYSKGYHHALVRELLAIQDEAQTCIKLVFTSRLLPDLEALFHNYCSIEIRASEHDLAKLVDGSIHPDIQPLYKLVTRQVTLRDQIKNAVLKSANGSFLLAKLHMQSLAEEFTIGNLKRKLRLLDEGALSYLEAYQSTLERIQSQGKIGALAVSALTWVVFAERQLESGELVHALGTKLGTNSLDEDDLPDIEDILSACYGLLTLDRGTRIVALVHHTAQEFLKEHGHAWLKSPHTLISDICICYLNFEDLQQRNSSDKQISELSKRFALWDYAFRHCEDHIAKREQPIAVEQIIEMQDHSQASGLSMMELSVPRYLQLCRENPGLTGLHLMAACGLTGPMETLLERYDMNAKNAFGKRAIDYAVEKGQSEAVRLLISRGALLDSRNEHGDGLLTAALNSDLDNTIPILLAEAGGKALFDQTEDEGIWVLRYAIQQDDVELATILLRKASSCVLAYQIQHHYLDPSLLIFAMAHSTTEAITVQLVPFEKDLDCIDHSGNTALHHAVAKGYHETVRALVSRGAAGNASNKAGNIPLAYGINEQNSFENTLWTLAEKLQFIRLFLDHGSNPMSILSAILWKSEDPEFPNHARLENTDARILIQIYVAYLSKDLSLSAVSIHKGFADLSRRARSYCCQLVNADTSCSLLEALLDSGMRLDEWDPVGETALMHASVYGRLDLLKVLLQRKADVNRRNMEGRTALEIAVTDCATITTEIRAEMMTLLIRCGADIGSFNHALSHVFGTEEWSSNGMLLSIKSLDGQFVSLLNRACETKNPNQKVRHLLQTNCAGLTRRTLRENLVTILNLGRPGP